MQKKIATIEVFVDPESHESSGSGGSNGQYVLHLNGGPNFARIKTKKQLQTVMAHEMGHLIGLITGDPDHDNRNQFAYRMTGNTDFVLPAERKAWAWAHEMGLDLDPKQERKGIESYEREAQHWSFSHTPPSEPVPVWYWVAMAILIPFLAGLTTFVELASGIEVLR